MASGPGRSERESVGRLEIRTLTVSFGSIPDSVTLKLELDKHSVPVLGHESTKVPWVRSSGLGSLVVELNEDKVPLSVWQLEDTTRMFFSCTRGPIWKVGHRLLSHKGKSKRVY
jgi:hypothetical protein